MGIIETMNNTANIKFFWNGLKVAGDRKMTVKGHWSYQAAQTTPATELAEHVTFYAGYCEQSDEICKSFGGNGFAMSLDDCATRPKFTLTPADPRWADAMAAAITGAQRTLASLQRRAAKQPGCEYARNECGYQIARIEQLQSAIAPAAVVDPMIASLEALIGPL